MRWALKDNSAPGFDPSFTYGLYTILIKGFLFDSNQTETDNFTFDLDVNCCMSPTVITAPSMTISSYSYAVSMSALIVTLPGDWTGDNSCCTVSAGSTSISPSPPAGLFTVAGDNSSVTVFTNDNSAVGITYTITVSAQSSSCFSISDQVIYTVTIESSPSCNDATLSIDPPNTVFLSPPAITLSYTVGDGMTFFSWNRAL